MGCPGGGSRAAEPAAPTLSRGHDSYFATTRVRDALEDVLNRYGFVRKEYDAKTYWIEFAGRRIRLPNPRSRRIMVPFHDLHRVATGYTADLRGEAEIGAWKLRAGCTTATLWIINAAAALMGLVVTPRRTLAAFRAGAGATTLYRLDVSYNDMLDLTVGELRDLLSIPPGGSTGEAVWRRHRWPAGWSNGLPGVAG